MATENANTPRKKSPLEEFLSEKTLEVRSDLKVLFATLSGDELLETVIERLQQYAVVEWDRSRDPYFNNTRSPHMLYHIQLKYFHKSVILCCNISTQVRQL